MTDRIRTPRAVTAAGRALALLAGALFVVAMFLPWTDDGHLALDLGLTGLGGTPAQPTVAVVLVALAAVPSVAALIGNHPAPRVVAAVGAGVLVLAWLAAGPDGALAPGVVAGLLGTIALAFSAALAHRYPARRGQGSGGTDAGEEPADAGFRHLDHTADTAIEAWGPTRAACLAAAVRGLIASFADIGGVAPGDRHPVVVGPGDDTDVLVELLDEVIYVLDARRAVVVGVSLRDTDTGAVEGSFDLAPVGAVRPAGAVPKAVTYHDLRIGEDEHGTWRAHVIIDV